MAWLVRNMKWIMLACGVLTCTMFFAAVAPQAALQATFGDSLQGPMAEIVVRNWGILIGLIGVMLIYGAFHPAARPLVLSVAGTSKLCFIALVLLFGEDYLAQAGVTLAADLVQVGLFAGYLLATRPGGQGPG